MADLFKLTEMPDNLVVARIVLVPPSSPYHKQLSQMAPRLEEHPDSNMGTLVSGSVIGSSPIIMIEGVGTTNEEKNTNAIKIRKMLSNGSFEMIVQEDSRRIDNIARDQGRDNADIICDLLRDNEIRGYGKLLHPKGKKHNLMFTSTFREVPEIDPRFHHSVMLAYSSSDPKELITILKNEGLISAAELQTGMSDLDLNRTRNRGEK